VGPPERNWHTQYNRLSDHQGPPIAQEPPKSGENASESRRIKRLGIIPIQPAKAFGSRMGTATEEECEACRQLRVKLAINYRATDFKKKRVP
jgi:hypothetical protein